MTKIQNSNNATSTTKGGANLVSNKPTTTDSSDDQPLFQTKRLILSSKDEYIQKQQGSICKSDITWLPGTVRAAPAIRTATSAFVSIALITISLALIWAVLENLPASSSQQESLRDHSLFCLLLPMLIIYYTNGAIVEQFVNMFTVSKHRQLANILQLQRTLGPKGSQIQINFEDFFSAPELQVASVQSCKVHCSTDNNSNSTKNKFTRNTIYSNDCSKRAILFSDEGCNLPSLIPVDAKKLSSVKNDTDEMNMSESSCSTDASYGLFSNNNRKQNKKQVQAQENSKNNKCTCNGTPDSEKSKQSDQADKLNCIDAETLEQLLQTDNAPSFSFNVLEVFLLTCNVSQHLLDVKEIFLVKAWLIISIVILLYFITVTNFTFIDAELESIRKEELKENKENELKHTGDKPQSKDSIKSDTGPNQKTLNGKQGKRRIKQTSVSNLLKQEKMNQLTEEVGTLILTEKEIRQNKTLMIFNFVQILKQVGEFILRTCFFIFNVLMFFITISNMNDDY